MTLDLALGKEFDYLIPDDLADVVEVGTRVKVPFARRQVLGCVTDLLETSPHPNLRPILKTIGRQSHVTPKILALARWLGEYYCCPPETALKTVLPQAVRQEKEGWREQIFVHALPDPETMPKLSPRQREILDKARAAKECLLQSLLRQTKTTTQTLRRLEDKGLIRLAPQISERDPYARDIILPTQPLALNAEQQPAVAAIIGAVEAAGGVGQAKPVFLLHGVTGSAKTEVYLQAIAHTLQRGQGAIVLVPEISLTPQTVERFKARFSAGATRTLVAVLHSHLSTGERHDEWHKIRQGRARIVIGARSAVFAPVDPLGLIIVDEEHEHSYKQEEAPRYHARDVAVVRGRMEG
ncbi:MAG TPA: DEAD/DEAH box helicase, partial [Candidatus Cybelea sp.]|nr:DEAD/DEAH box helicase [Candidatus Cybelea sp.]